MVNFDALKKFFNKEYDMKSPGKVKTIIRWQINRDIVISTMKINHQKLIQDLVIEDKLNNCNANIILLKARLSIEIRDFEDYKETNFWIYK